jgi:hypothetical protein
LGRADGKGVSVQSLTPQTMFRHLLHVFAVTLLLSSSSVRSAPLSPSYVKQVRPLLARYCLECHNAATTKSDLNLESFDGIRQGGTNGPVLVAGKPDESRLVLLPEGKAKPPMPPKRAKQPKPEEVAVLRAWVAAGAKDDSERSVVTLPRIGPRSERFPPVTALAYRPDGKLLVVGRDKSVIFVEPSKGEILDELHGIPGHITALAYAPDGSRLAVAASVPASLGQVLIYAREAGQAASTPPTTLSRHKDAILCLAFAPNGRFLATAGYDRTIKLWDLFSDKELATLTDHSDAVYGVAFSPDSQFIASASADRTVKLWSAATGKRLHTLSESTDWLYSIAWSPDGRHIAAAGVDKSIRVWEVSPQGGKLTRSVFGHEAPVIRLIYAPDGMTLYSLGEDRVLKSWDAATMLERHVYEKQPDSVLAAALRPDQKQIVLGRYDGSLTFVETDTGKTRYQSLPAPDLFPFVAHVSRSDSPNHAPLLKLPISTAGVLNRGGSIDYYRFEAAAGQQVGIQLTWPSPESKFEAVMQLSSEAGGVVAESTNGLLGHSCQLAGAYILSVRDRDYGGGPEKRYHLRFGNIPIVARVFPLGLQRATEAEIHVEGVNLGSVRSVRVKAPADATVGSRLPITIRTPDGTALGDASVTVGEFPEVLDNEVIGNDRLKPVAPTRTRTIPTPGTANGLIRSPGQTESWRFAAKKGQRLILEVNARRLGSPLDSYIEILGSKGHPVPRAVLRPVAKTYVTFRDHDSANAAIRIENWSELAINDYLWSGNELIRIEELPKNPDDDCRFFSRHGQRTGFLDTTPVHLSLGTPLYKVAIHSPGASFPPNGFSLVTLYYRNDDGGPGFGKDSRLFFDPPADGDYQVRIGDSLGHGGSAYAYRLTVRPPRPDFSVSFNPTAPAVWRGGAVPVTASADRTDGFDGAIEVRLENLPPGFSAPATTIPAEENSTTFSLSATSEAKTPGQVPPLKLVGRAAANGHELRHDAVGHTPKTVEPGDIETSLEQSEFSVHPGDQIRVHARIKRRNGFKGRVPLEVRGLPHGIRVLDIGLNGILITENENERTFVIYAEPWVTPQTHPFVVLAKHEGKGTEHAATSVLLKVNSR